MKYYQTFKVSGGGCFPFDMLRYDSCWPNTQDDVDKMLSVGFRAVGMAHRVYSKDFGPTIDRWASFGWDVSNIYTQKV